MMSEPAPREGVDVERLEALLEVLANANRIGILLQLREPKTAGEILLHPPSAATKPGENPERPISRQAVRVHLEKLVGIGVVVPRRGRRGTLPVDEYVISQQRLFAIAEEFRALGSLRPVLPPGVEQTLDGAVRPKAGLTAGVRLVLVHGLDEGKTFPLRLEEAEGDRGWIIGRRRGIAVSLDYDPFISAENSEITREDGRYVLHDLRSSRNGTHVNWQRLPRGGAHTLVPGDVVGVGRSLLLFQRD
jgi:FHA domain-containing protein